MKYLNGYKIFENKAEIDSLCHGYGINRYTIGSDGLVNVDGDVLLSYLRFAKLPIKFGLVTGDFSCPNNRMISLEGCPDKVVGTFRCFDNDVTSLSGAPSEVGGDFIFHNNKLTSLEGCSNKIGGFLNCRNNKITNLEGCPKLGAYFNFDNNPIYYIIDKFIGRPNKNELVELFNDADIIRGNEIIWDRLVWFFDEIEEELPDFLYAGKYYKIIR